jgi:hypothetical protein
LDTSITSWQLKLGSGWTQAIQTGSVQSQGDVVSEKTEKNKQEGKLTSLLMSYDVLGEPDAAAAPAAPGKRRDSMKKPL